MKSRSISTSLGSAIGVAALLSLASPELAFPDSPQTAGASAGELETGEATTAASAPESETAEAATAASALESQTGEAATAASALESQTGEAATEASAPAAQAAAATTKTGDSTKESSAPTQVVDELHENLISVMKEAETLGYDGRFARLEPVINELFDIPFMAEKSIGRHWKTVDEENRADLLATFERFTIANYAGRFTGYSGQSFETLSERQSKHGTVLVYSRLVSGNGETVQLNYRLRPAENHGWRIIDVLLNGTVSELALRRSEYSSLIQREGFAALISALNQRIDDLADGKVQDKAS